MFQENNFEFLDFWGFGRLWTTVCCGVGKQHSYLVGWLTTPIGRVAPVYVDTVEVVAGQKQRYIIDEGIWVRGYSLWKTNQG